MHSAWLSKEGQFLLPMLELSQHAEAGMYQVIGVAGPVTIGSMLKLSAG